MSSTRSRRRRARVPSLALATLLVGVLGLAGPASAQTEPDADLDQAIRAEQPVAPGDRTLEEGHVDVGPRFVDGRWTLLVHDDRARAVADAESVWRHAERTVLRVTDDAVMTVPEDETYSFLPAEPGDRVHVVPQTQDPDVVWVGWNTQDPEVMERIDRGVTMTLTGVEGPGDLVVYLQSGDFGDPQVLWDSTAKPEPVWVDVNTHTHANWVFSRPGVYLVRVRIAADLVDGTTVSDTRDLRFAVGDAAKPADALAASWNGPDPSVGDGERAEPAVAEADGGGGGSGGAIVAIAAIAVGLGAVLLATTVRGRRARARARDARPADPAAGSAPTGVPRAPDIVPGGPTGDDA